MIHRDEDQTQQIHQSVVRSFFLELLNCWIVGLWNRPEKTWRKTNSRKNQSGSLGDYRISTPPTPTALRPPPLCELSIYIPAFPLAALPWADELRLNSCLHFPSTAAHFWRSSETLSHVLCYDCVLAEEEKELLRSFRVKRFTANCRPRQMGVITKWQIYSIYCTASGGAPSGSRSLSLCWTNITSSRPRSARLWVTSMRTLP